MQAFFDILNDPHTLIAVALRSLFAALCGCLLGLERSRKRRAAGIRTYMMVCVGACVVMQTGILMQSSFGGDPARLGAQVVSGIGFLGAGAIIVTGYHQVQGLTTAAGLWVAAALGLAIGAGYFVIAAVSGGILALSLFLGGKLEKVIISHASRMRLVAFFENADCIPSFVKHAAELGFSVQSYEYISVSETGKAGVIFYIRRPPSETAAHSLELLSKSDGVYFAEFL